MSTTPTSGNKAERTDQGIKSRKIEMKTLLMHVLREPLGPEIVERLSKLEERSVEVQIIRDETGEISATDDIRKRGDVLKKLRALRDAYTYEIDSLVAARLSSGAQDMAQFLQDPTSVKGLLDEMQQDQTSPGHILSKSDALLIQLLSELDSIGQYPKTVAKESGKALVSIGDESSANEKGLG